MVEHGGEPSWCGGFAVLAVGFGATGAQGAPFVYVTNLFSNNVSQYNVGTGGLLSPLVPPTVAAGVVPEGVAVSPDGRNVYVANEDGNTVSQYDLGPGGALAPKSPPEVAAGDSASGVAGQPGRRQRLRHE